MCLNKIVYTGLPSYFEFSNDSVLIHHILVVVVATFTSEKVETVEPVLKVVKLTLQFLWVHLSRGQGKIAIRIVNRALFTILV